MSSMSDPNARQGDPQIKLALGLLRLEQALASARGGAAAEVGLSPLQTQILIDLAHDAGGDRTAGHLARRYGVSAATLSDSVKGLLGKRLVRATASRADARRRDLTLTATGRRAAATAQQKLDTLVRLCAELSPATLGACLEGVVHLIRRCNELGWIQTDRMCVTCRFFARDHAPGTDRPHFCKLVGAPLGGFDLRIDCPEHQPVESTPS